MPQISKAFLRITAIEPQKSTRGQSASGGKRSGRFNVFTDNKFAFSIDEITLAQSHLKTGDNLTSDQIEEFIGKNQTGKLQEAALRYLSYRPRSEKEVADYLTQKIAKSQNIKFNQAKESPQIRKVISKLKKYNYLNDQEFAKWFVSSRIRSHPKGLSLIRLELKTKGITPDTIETILTSSIDEHQLALDALKKKSKKWHNLSGIDLKKKVYQYLASRGFSYDIIKEAFANLVQKD